MTLHNTYITLPPVLNSKIQCHCPYLSGMLRCCRNEYLLGSGCSVQLGMLIGPIDRVVGVVQLWPVPGALKTFQSCFEPHSCLDQPGFSSLASQYVSCALDHVRS